MAVEEARKRIHAVLDAGEDPLTPSTDKEGHEVLERLHLRPAAKARFTGPRLQASRVLIERHLRRGIWIPEAPQWSVLPLLLSQEEPAIVLLQGLHPQGMGSLEVPADKP
eukprot:4617535-Amphidinium_carterae.1